MKLAQLVKDVFFVDPMPNREVWLDFIRGIAIMLALGWHFNGSYNQPGILNIFLIPGKTIGWVGVDLFFVLSGFLIGGLIFKEYDRTGDFDASKFLIRRAFKIWPILYAYLLLLLFVGRYPWESYLLQNIFHVQNYFMTPLAHLWSLAVEEQFYLLFAFGFLLIIRKSKDHVKLLPIYLMSMMILAFILRICAYLGGVEPHDIQVQTQFRIDALSCGILLAYLNFYEHERFSQIARHKVLLFFTFLLGSILLVVMSDNLGLAYTVRYSLSYLTGAAFLLFCYKVAFIERRPWLIRVIAGIGVYSYAMYIYQFVIWRVSESVLARAGIVDVSEATMLFIKYAGAILLAITITKVIERPFLFLRDKFFPSNTARNISFKNGT